MEKGILDSSMGLNDTVSSERIHISFFGMRNVGKSSIVNAITNQEVSIVSNIKGTTTDPVKKTMEILPLGPTTIIDTAGIDDENELGEKRIKKTYDILNETDIAILVVDIMNFFIDGKFFKENFSSYEKKLLEIFVDKNIPYIIVYNKIDLMPFFELCDIEKILNDNEILLSTINNTNLDELKNKISKIKNFNEEKKPIVGDLLDENDLAILVIPIDESAPKGRLILPQQLVIRDILDSNATMMISKPSELDVMLKKLNAKPKLIITDSQVFKEVEKIIPKNILFTSFSILMARYRGDLKILINGKNAISNLKNNDKILIAEACTHHRQCNDIGTVKIPSWLEKITNKKFNFIFSSGHTFPENLDDIKLIIHCGGCMITEKEMKNRLSIAKNKNIPIINYGILIAFINGILDRALEPFDKF